MRSPSLTTRWRTSFLVSDRMAALISFSRPSKLLRQTLVREDLDPVLFRAPLLLAGDSQRLGELVGHGAGDRLEDVLAVVDEHRELRRGGRGETGLDRGGGEDPLRFAQRRDKRLGGLEALGDGFPSSGATAPVFSASASSLSVCGVDSASTIMIATSPSSSIRPATTMSNVASSSCGCVGKATPLVLDQRDPDAADRAGERQARELGGHGCGVDRHHVV